MTIRAVVFEECGIWVAQCIEFDIVAAAITQDELRKRLALTIEAEKRTSTELNGAPFAGIPAAPRRFFDMWDKQGGWSLAA